MKKLFVYLAIFCLVCEAFGRIKHLSAKRRGMSRKSKRVNLIESFSAKLVDYLNLENMLRSETANTTITQMDSGSNSQCSTVDEINNYFLKVYSDSGVINSSYLDNMVHYQVKRVERPKEVEDNSKKNLCRRKKCFQSGDIFNLTSMSEIRTVEDLKTVCPMLLYNFELGFCEIDDEKKQLNQEQIWLIGFILCFLSSLLSWNGILLMPFVKKKIYKRFLTFMISLAFGCVLSNSLFKYLPLADSIEALMLNEFENSFFYKHMVIMGMIFFFFMVERTMELVTIYKNMKRNKREVDQLLGRKPKKARKPKQDLDRDESIDVKDINIIGQVSLHEMTNKFPEHLLNGEKAEDQGSFDIAALGNERICCTSLTKGIGQIRPIGIMSLIGDSLSNFIDGLSIGAAINQGVVQGISVTIAVWSGNFPQELGDFAVLVRSGMTPFQAVFYNYISANTVYFGCILGIIFGGEIEGARWIFSISAATTMYISLGILLPEMNSEFEDSGDSFIEKLRITRIQVLGIIFGVCLMTILNIYEDEMQL